MNNVAIFGYGVVGRGVKEIIDRLDRRYDVNIKKVFDIEAKRPQLKSLLVTDYHEIIADDEISIVFECLGGDSLPYEVITSSLKKGKSVITSNKETIAKHLPEYLQMVKEYHGNLLFEASVGGGIPLLHNISKISCYDEINSFKGILNGSTNYLLTRIFLDDVSLADALKEAREKGFLESDPRDDLQGIDLLRKGVILSDLAFQSSLSLDEVFHFGIDSLNEEIIQYIKDSGKILKLLVEGKKNEDGTLSLLIAPHLLRKDDFFAGVNYEFNELLLDAKYNGLVAFYGKGAGCLPTGSAMVQDLMTLLTSKKIIYPDIEVGRYQVKRNQKFLVYKNHQIKEMDVHDLHELKEYEFVCQMD